MSDQKTCKLCQMPLVKDKDFGTNADGSKNEEYCAYCMKNGHIAQFCQSCGMPMHDGDYGTETDGSASADYCRFCYQNGKFTQDITMDEMIAQCAAMSWGENDHTSQEEKIAIMKSMYPELKRWKKEK